MAIWVYFAINRRNAELQGRIKVELTSLSNTFFGSLSNHESDKLESIEHSVEYWNFKEMNLGEVPNVNCTSIVRYILVS